MSASESIGILSLKIPYRFEPVSEFVFGTHNAAFVQVMYEEWLRDPNSVGAEWRELFENGKLAQLPIIPKGSGEWGVVRAVTTQPAGAIATESTTPHSPL